MDPRCRAFAPWAALLTAACGAGEPAAPVRAAAPAPRPVPGLEEARSWPLVREETISLGHGAGGDYRVLVRAAPEHAARYRALVPGQPLPAGFRAAAFHTARRGGAPGSVFVAEKRADGAWALVVTDAAGRPLQGDDGLCRACHAESAHDFVFGPARNEPPPGSVPPPGP